MNLRVLRALGARLGAPVSVTDEDVADLIRRVAEANSALARGDVDGYLALIEHAQDYTLMAPFGGAPTEGFDTSSENRAERAAALARGDQR